MRSKTSLGLLFFVGVAISIPFLLEVFGAVDAGYRMSAPGVDATWPLACVGSILMIVGFVALIANNKNKTSK